MWFWRHFFTSYRHKTFGTKKKKYWFVFKGTVPFISILDYLLVFLEKIPCQAVECYVLFSYSDTILSLFKSQEEAFGAPVHKMNLRGRKTN